VRGTYGVHRRTVAGPSLTRRTPWIHAGPEDLKCIISWDTRAAGFVPSSIHDGMLSLWPHTIHWVLHEKYSGDRPVGRDGVDAKPRLQINPCTWTSEGGGGPEGHLGANPHHGLINAKGGDDGKLVAPAEYADGIIVSDMAVSVPEFETWLGPSKGPIAHGNLHPIDVHFFYYNIVRNIEVRLEAWRRARGMEEAFQFQA
jgi:hypothetical protein